MIKSDIVLGCNNPMSNTISETHQTYLSKISEQLVNAEFISTNGAGWPRDIAKTVTMVDNEPPKSVPLATIAFRRLGFGAKAGDLAAFRSLGASEAVCLRNYIEQQLRPNEIDDYACKIILAKHPYWHIYRQSSWQLWHDYAQNNANWEMRMRPLETTEQITFLRAIHSKRQLFEKMVSFWRNHFHVNGRAYDTAPLIPDFDMMVLRTHTFGNFRQLLHAAVSHPAMLLAHTNDENRVRQHHLKLAEHLLSEFTLGEDASFGDQRPDQVPKDKDGRPIGYTIDDIRGAARALTGWTARDGRFQYRHDWHDVAGKWIMDLYLPPGQPHRTDGNMLLDWLAEHPVTAKHICTSLCTFFLGHEPPQSLVTSAADQFIKYKDHPEQIVKVIRHILYTKSLLTTWGNAKPTYFAHLVTLLRGLGLPIAFHPQDENTSNLLLAVRLAGRALFSGAEGQRPHTAEDINDVIRWLLTRYEPMYSSQLLTKDPAGDRTPLELVRYWSQRLLGMQLPELAQHSIANKLAQGDLQDTPLKRDPNSEHGRAALHQLRIALAQIMQHPAFFRI